MISEIKHKNSIDRKIFIKLFNKLSAQLLEKVKISIMDIYLETSKWYLYFQMAIFSQNFCFIIFVYNRDVYWSCYCHLKDKEKGIQDYIFKQNTRKNSTK